MTETAADTVETCQLVLRERQCRDRGWWDDMRSCYSPGSRVRLSWFEGSGVGFVAASQEMAERGDKASHRLQPPVVELHGDRALVEMGAVIETRAVIDDVELDLVSYARLIYRVQRHDDRWLITALDPVYERDTLTPALPGTDFQIAPAALAGLRSSYRMLSYALARRGYTIADDLYGDDLPDDVRVLEHQSRTWLHE